jgi:hypothetical protein
MTDTFLNCQQNIFLEKFPEKKLSWVFFAEKLPLTGMGCFSEVF